MIIEDNTDENIEMMDRRYAGRSNWPIIVLSILLPIFFFAGWAVKGYTNSQMAPSSEGAQFGVGGAPFDQSPTPSMGIIGNTSPTQTVIPTDTPISTPTSTVTGDMNPTGATGTTGSY
jgi:hypothetical protein